MKNTILITGATGAVGRATVKELALRGANDLILAGRNKPLLEELGREVSDINSTLAVELIEMDLSSIKSVGQAIVSIKAIENNLKGILNIAAVYRGKKTVTVDGLESMFATNHLGPFQLTTGLLSRLTNTLNSRVVTVTAPSTTNLKFDDLQSEKKYSSFSAFGASKMANLLFTYKLAREFEKTSSTAICYHPGLVKSELMNDMPNVLNVLFMMIAAKPEETARSLASLITEEKFNTANGKFFNKKLKEIKSSGYSHDTQIQDKLWEVSKELIGNG